MDDRKLRAAEGLLRLLAEATRGTRAAQATVRSLAEGRLTPESVVRQIASYLPAGMKPPTPASLQAWTEDLWSTVGVVPRSRYVELLERYEALRARLEEAEVTIRRLRRLLEESGHEDDARKILDLWSNAVGETLRSQAEWMRTLIGVADEAPALHPAPEATKPPPAPASRRAKRRPAARSSTKP
jgi:hypothetical protein